jgi:3',5'-cyclic-AMP phosphodiesterase
MIVFAQVSDTHFDGSQTHADRARAVFDRLNAVSIPLTAVLLTGDIADHGLPQEYDEARKLVASSAHPVFSCPGNHDDRVAYREVLLGEPGAEPELPINRLHRVPGAVFALCDSSIPGRNDGYLADETLDWLDAVLTEDPGVPAFVCFHHPPALLHSPFLDSIRQFGEPRLAALVARHPQIVALLCGHAHTPAATTFAGLPLLVAPGVVSTLVLPWEGDGGGDESAPPGFAFHVLDDERRLTTHYRALA